MPYKQDAPVRLLKAHEENMLQDLRETMDNVIENTIAEARRHAVSTLFFISLNYVVTNQRCYCLILGSSSESCQNGRLLSDHVFQPERLLWK